MKATDLKPGNTYHASERGPAPITVIKLLKRRDPAYVRLLVEQRGQKFLSDLPVDSEVSP